MLKSPHIFENQELRKVHWRTTGKIGENREHDANLHKS